MNNTSESQQPARILLVEDSPGDIILTRKAFEQARILNELVVIENGEDAIKYLKTTSPLKKPDLILLDLNLPRVNGYEVLSFIKSAPILKRIPVIILTTSSTEMDIIKSYDLHANGYIIKPVKFSSLVESLTSFQDFWLNVVRLPDTKE